MPLRCMPEYIFSVSLPLLALSVYPYSAFLVEDPFLTSLIVGFLCSVGDICLLVQKISMEPLIRVF